MSNPRQRDLTPELGLLICFCRYLLLWNVWPAMHEEQKRLALVLAGRLG